MKKTKAEIESEKFWNDFFKQARQIRKIEKEEEIQQKKEEQKQQATKKSFFLKGFQGQNQSQNDKIPHGETYAFQSSNFQTNNGVTAIFKRISSSTTAAGAGRTGNYIGKIAEDDKTQMLFYRGYDYFDDIEQKTIKNMIAYNKDAKEFLNNCFEEDIESLSPTIGGQNEIESHHYVFSLPEYTRTKDNKILPKEKLNEIIEQATKNVIKNNEILSKRAILMAVHQENHAHILISATNFQGKKDLRYITNAQQMDILRDFTKECRNLGLNVQIPPKKEKPLNLKELNKITSIEYKENNEIKAITLENSQGATKRLSAVSINDFMQKNGLKINDKISIEIQKNKFGRNFYKLLEKEENTEKEEPKIIKVSEQKEELNRLLQAEQQRQEKERAEEKKQHEDKTKQEEQERKEKEDKILREIEKAKKIIKAKLEKAKQEEKEYKQATNQNYEGFKTIKFGLWNSKLKFFENFSEEIKKYDNESLSLNIEEIEKNPNYFLRIPKEIYGYIEIEEERIQERIKEWKQEQAEKPIEKPIEIKKQEPKQEIKEQPKPQEPKQEIKKPIEQEPKREYIKPRPKPKKKDRGFSR